jgi:ABC-2 type transport system permease protein
MTTVTSTRVERPGALPPTLRLGLSRGLLEVKQLLRDREAFFFTLGFPVLILLLFNAMFDRPYGDTGATVSQVFTAGIIAMGIAVAGFQSLGISIAQERDDGTLKRLRGLPMPKSAYFIGKIVQVALVALAEIVILLGVAVLFFGLDLPTEPRRWAIFAAVTLLGLACCTLLGIAVSSLARSGRNASAIVLPPFIALQFISGVYFIYNEIPRTLQQIAAIFPLKWMTQGMRSVFLPDAYLAFEPAGSWETGPTLLILAAWTLGALMLCLLTFRWGKRGE